MFEKTSELAPKAPLRDMALRARDSLSVKLAGTSVSRAFSCWGERLLLRTADREMRRMRRCGGETVRNEETDK